MNESINKNSEKVWTKEEAELEIGSLRDKAGVMGVNESETSRLIDLLAGLENGSNPTKSVAEAHGIFNSKGENNF